MADAIPTGTKGPFDDFFCGKYQVWYRVEDCVYRGRNRTYPGCANCLQGYVNMRSVARGQRPPIFFNAESSAADVDARTTAVILPLRRVRERV